MLGPGILGHSPLRLLCRTLPLGLLGKAPRLVIGLLLHVARLRNLTWNLRLRKSAMLSSRILRAQRLPLRLAWL